MLDPRRPSQQQFVKCRVISDLFFSDEKFAYTLRSSQGSRARPSANKIHEIKSQYSSKVLVAKIATLQVWASFPSNGKKRAPLKLKVCDSGEMEWSLHQKVGITFTAQRLLDKKFRPWMPHTFHHELARMLIISKEGKRHPCTALYPTVYPNQRRTHITVLTVKTLTLRIRWEAFTPRSLLLKNQDFIKWVELISTPISNFIQTKANQQETHQNIPKQKRTQKADYSIRVKPNDYGSIDEYKEKDGSVTSCWEWREMNQERASGAREQPRPPKGFRRQRRCEGEENSKSQRRSSSLLLLGLFGKWGFKSCFLVFCTPLYETKWDGFWFVHVFGIVCGFYLLDGLSKVYSLLTFSSIIIFISSHFFPQVVCK